MGKKEAVEKAKIELEANISEIVRFYQNFLIIYLKFLNNIFCCHRITSLRVKYTLILNIIDIL